MCSESERLPPNPTLQVTAVNNLVLFSPIWMGVSVFYVDTEVQFRKMKEF